MTDGLRRELSTRQVEFLAMGGTVGAGFFVGSGQGLHMAGPMLGLAYGVCGLVVFIIARCLGELSIADPAQGSFVGHIDRQLGPAFAFVSGWSYWLTAVLVCMAELTAVGLLLHAWFPGLPQWIPAFLVMALLFAVNQSAVRIFGESEFWLAILKIGTIVVFLLLGLLAALLPGHLGLGDAGVANIWRFGTGAGGSVAGFCAVLPVALFSFGGVELFSMAAAETADPVRTLPRAVNGLLFRVIVFYLGATAALLVLMPWPLSVPGTSPFVSVLQRLHVPAAAALLNVVLISAVVSTCNSMLYGATRTLRTLALGGHAPARWAEVGRRGVPVTASRISVAVVSAVIVLNYLLPSEIFGLLLGMTAIVVTANWTLIVVAHLRFRRRRGSLGQPSPFPAPLSPVSNGLVLAFVAVLAVILALDPSQRAPFLLAVATFVVLAVLAALRARLRPSLRAERP